MRPPPQPHYPVETTGPPKFWGTPIARLPCSLTPVVRSSQTCTGRPHSPRFRYDEGANIM